MEVTGKIKVKNETQTFGSNGFRKREFVITTDEQYPQHIQLEFVQDKCDLLDKFEVGQDVKVSINLRGREWKNPEGVAKYFNTIQGWRIESLTQSSNNNTPTDETNVSTMVTSGSLEQPDDLPF